MPHTVLWVQWCPPLMLDARDDLCRSPPLLDDLSDKCWRHMLTQLVPAYGVLKRQWLAAGGGTIGNVRCVSHPQCQVDIQCRLVGQSIGCFAREDRTHAIKDRQVEGLTTLQWQVFVCSSSTTL